MTSVVIAATQSNIHEARHFTIACEPMTGMYWRDLDNIKRAARKQLPEGYWLLSIVTAPACSDCGSLTAHRDGCVYELPNI